MNTNSQNQLILSIISGILISVIYPSVYTKFSAVDKIAPQWLFMTIMNGLSILSIIQ